ncbi:hypothetical protein ATY41_04370 [Leifsonia xyli subsp. xyli]|uniref:Uncharacterized protein n=1 Tax=Leifsonia xyli subsp. xyli TaxID=59736 RepID=A0A1E2SIK8_LEIXY|nr:hypothetical protein [Leifsonia xyli]ODA89695.1 hypothetical protein ATY41_04370 [Leifsonia xyli subsp. xyli]
MTAGAEEPVPAAAMAEPSASPADAAPHTHAAPGAEQAAPGERPGDIPFDQAAAEHENPALG